MNEKEPRLPYTTPEQIDSSIKDFDQVFERPPTSEEITYLRSAQQLLRDKSKKSKASATSAGTADD